jgi:hypothetical protein
VVALPLVLLARHCPDYRPGGFLVHLRSVSLSCIRPDSSYQRQQCCWKLRRASGSFHVPSPSLSLSLSLSLTLEAIGAERCGQIGVQHLDRDRPLVLLILGQVDRGHPASAELPPEHVAVGNRGLQALDQRHERVMLDLCVEGDGRSPRHDVASGGGFVD